MNATPAIWQLTLVTGAGGVEVRAQVGGRALPPVPLAALEIHDRALQRTERSERLTVLRCEQHGAAARVMLGDPDRGIEIGLTVEWTADELAVRFAPAEVVERDPQMYRLFAVDVLPGLLQVQHGTLLLPINTGLRVSTSTAPAVSDRFLIYGEQDRWELTPALPICAATDATGGLYCLAVRGACDTDCRVMTDGRAGGETRLGFSLRRYWPDPVDAGERELRWGLIPAGTEALPVCAQRLRRHVREDLGKRTLRDRAAESPAVAYLLGASIVKLFHGMKNEGLLRQPGFARGEFRSTLSFAEAAAGLRRLRAAGVGQVLCQSVGWNTGGHDGLYPTRFPIEERLGGETGFRELIESAHQLGYQLNVHDNFIMQCAASPDLELEHVTHDRFGLPVVHGRWAGGLEYQGWGLALPEDRVTGHMERLRALGLRGMFYADYMQQPLEVNHHPRHRGSRADCVRGMVRIVTAGRQVFGACGTEFGFLPCAVAADHIVTCGDAWHLKACRPDWPITALLDPAHVVPLWQCALSGLVLLEGQGITWRDAMTNVLLGRIPRDEWSAHPGWMPVLDDRRVAAWQAMNELCTGRFSHLRAEAIVSWSQPAPAVQQTRFADGTEVIADYGAGQLQVNGQGIAAPAALAPPAR